MQYNLNIHNDCRGMLNEEIIETILDSRGVKNPEEFLNPSVDNMLPLDSFYRIKEAGDVVIDGISKGSKFMVWGDVDVDGCSSNAIMVRYLREMGCHCDWGINDGKAHGTSDKIFEKINEYKPDILIIVDSLDSNIDNYKRIKDMGIDIVILDHHDVNPDISYDDYVWLVSSNRQYDNPELSGAGVTFKFCLYLDSQLGTVIADQFFDLACCGILADVCDVSETSMENRFIVKTGLENPVNPGILKILGGYTFNSTSVLYSIAPLINAANRLNKNEDAANLFLSDDNKEVANYLKTLKKCKENQNKIIDSILPDLIEQAESQLDKKMIVVIVDKGSGLSGLIATRLQSIYQRQIMVLKENYGGYSGSCRAFGDFREICADTGLGEFAGHPGSFGVVNIPYQNFDKFREIIEDKLGGLELKSDIDVDIELDVADVNKDLVQKIKELDFVSGQNFKPIHAAITCNEYEATTMSKGKHLVIEPSHWFKFIKWNAGATVEEYEDHALCGDELTFVGTLDEGFLGRNYSIRMICDDIIID